MSTVLAVAEHRQGELRPVTHEVITAGRDLADLIDGALHVAVIGGDVDRFADGCSLDGVDHIHTVAEGESFNHDIYCRAIETIVADCQPTAILTPNSVNGLDYAPALATALDWPIVTDITALTGTDPLSVTREMYGSKVETELTIDAPRAVLTIRESAWEPTTTPAPTPIEPVDIGTVTPPTTVQEIRAVTDSDIDITDAECIVAVGRGIEEAENLPLVEALASAIGGTLAASRPIIDNGWLPPSRQVGQSGATVDPTVYLAIGISGAVQHVAGMKGADTIIAINSDPDAPIFDIADYGIVDDLFAVVPPLIEAFGGEPPDL